MSFSKVFQFSTPSLDPNGKLNAKEYWRETSVQMGSRVADNKIKEWSTQGASLMIGSHKRPPMTKASNSTRFILPFNLDCL